MKSWGRGKAPLAKFREYLSRVRDNCLGQSSQSYRARLMLMPIRIVVSLDIPALPDRTLWQPERVHVVDQYAEPETPRVPEYPSASDNRMLVGYQ